MADTQNVFVAVLSACSIEFLSCSSFGETLFVWFCLGSFDLKSFKFCHLCSRNRDTLVNRTELEISKGYKIVVRKPQSNL